MPDDSEVIRVVKEFCFQNVFERKTQGGVDRDDYKQSWRDHAKKVKGVEVKEEGLTKFTTLAIQDEVQRKFGILDIARERKVEGSSQLSFDLWNTTEGTALEICLGPIKNEFEKDVLKGILDRETTKLVIFFREYGYGTAGNTYGKRFFEQPAQREIMDRASIYKLKVVPISLIL